MEYKIRIGSNKNNNCRTARLSQIFGRFHSIHPAHFYVQENNVRRPFLISSQKLFPALRFSNMIFKPAQLQLCPGNMTQVIS